MPGKPALAKPNVLEPMKIAARKINNWLVFAAMMLLTACVSFGHSVPPLLQDIKVVKENPAPKASGTPTLVRKTGRSSPASGPLNSVRTLFPALSDVAIPGYSGVLGIVWMVM